MSEQEAEMQNNPEFQESECLDPSMNRFPFIQLNTTTDHCTMCGGSVKRPLHSPSSLNDSEPKFKRPMVEDDHLLRGFTNISLPIITSSSTPTIIPAISNSNSIPSPYPILRRCSSDPYNSPGTTTAANNAGAPVNHQVPDSVTGLGSFLNPLSPDNSAAKINVNATTPSPSPVRGSNSSALPPLPPTLRRSVSDPTSSAYQTPLRSFSRSPSSGEMGGGVQLPVEESPNSKRLKRMKDRMREMSKWWDDVMREGEDGGSEDNNHSNSTTKDASGIETEEEVSVENVGECLCIHFKCPCGKGYQILLSGRNCYYKLM